MSVSINQEENITDLEDQSPPTVDAAMQRKLTDLFKRFNKNLSVCVSSNRVGENGALFTNQQRKGSMISVTLKIDRSKMVHYDTDVEPRKTLHFDFPFVNKVLSQLQIIPFRQQLEFEMTMTDDEGGPLNVELLSFHGKRPEQLLSDENGRPIPSVTAEVRKRIVDPSPQRLDTVRFTRCKISPGVSSRFLHTSSRKFAFRVQASNVNLERWRACFPGCEEVPHALGRGFLVTTSRAEAMEKVRAGKKRQREEDATE
jgi:hypothetical protein